MIINSNIIFKPLNNRYFGTKVTVSEINEVELERELEQYFNQMVIENNNNNLADYFAQETAVDINNNNNTISQTTTTSTQGDGPDVNIDIGLVYKQEGNTEDNIDLDLVTERINTMKNFVSEMEEQVSRDITEQEITEKTLKQIKEDSNQNAEAAEEIITKVVSIRERLEALKATFWDLSHKLNEIISGWGYGGKILTGLVIGIAIGGGVYITYRIFFRNNTPVITVQQPQSPIIIHTPSTQIPTSNPTVPLPQNIPQDNILDTIRRQAPNNPNFRDVGLGAIAAAILIKVLRGI